MLKSPKLGILLLCGWTWGIKAAAQNPVPVQSGLAAAVAEIDFETNFNFRQLVEFGKAEVVGTDGKTHLVYIPLNALGFDGLLPFFYRREDVERFGSEPLNISVDKVQSIRTSTLYLEHIVVKGKRQHVLGARLVEGPVELFNYTQTKRIDGASTPTGQTISYMVYPQRHWYLRRQGELVEVSRHNFVPQLTQYFQDEPELVAALGNRQYRYRDMAALVTAYNERRAKAAPSLPSTN